MKRFLNKFLLLSFVLLQGIAPIAHAHINGSSVDAHIHLPSMDVRHGHVAAVGSAEYAQESPAIGNAQGCERTDRQAICSNLVVHAGFTRVVIATHAAPSYPIPFHPLIPHSAEYRKPFAQAPPAPISL